MTKYEIWYNALIKKRKIEIPKVYEKHHIIPKCMNGSNDLSNIAYLTPREHFIAHWLLTKFVEDKFKTKMIYALHRMSHIGDTKRIISSWQYDLVRKKVSWARKFDHSKIKYKGSNGKLKGYKWSAETIAKRSASLKGKPHKGKRKNQSGELNTNYGKHWYTDGKINKLILPVDAPVNYKLGRILK